MNKTVIEELKELTKDININDLYIKYDKCCPMCGHKAIIGRTYKVLCPKCSKGYDIIDILKVDYGVNDNLELLKTLRGNIKDIPYKTNENIQKIRQEHEKKEQDRLIKQQRDINMTFKNCTDLTDRAKEYLKLRALENVPGILNKDILDIKSNVYNNQETIIYRFRNQGTGIQKGLVKNEKEKRFVRNLGAVDVISYRINSSDEFYIVEGIEDGLSALVLGHNFICLNSIANFNKFSCRIIENPITFYKFKFKLCLDIDKGGFDTLEKIERVFKQYNINYDLATEFEIMLKYNIKDLNDFLILKNKGGI